MPRTRIGQIRRIQVSEAERPDLQCRIGRNLCGKLPCGIAGFFALENYRLHAAFKVISIAIRLSWHAAAVSDMYRAFGLSALL